MSPSDIPSGPAIGVVQLNISNMAFPSRISLQTSLSDLLQFYLTFLSTSLQFGFLL